MTASPATQKQTAMDGEDATSPAAGLARRDVGEFAAREVRAVARPGTVEEVVALVRQANADGRTLYPYSTGRNWGLGSRKPNRTTDTLVDLRRLATIRELDRERGFAVIEPGVTQQALAHALRGTAWTFNVTGSCADTSVLGNALERGVGYQHQRTVDLAGLEVVLGSGAQLRVGSFWSTGRPQFHYPHGIGPDLLPLMVQSNLGLVTAAAVKLVPRPESTRFICANFDDAALPAVIAALRRLYAQNVLRCVVKVFNEKLSAGFQSGLGREAPGCGLVAWVAGASEIVEALEQTVLAALRRATGGAELSSISGDVLDPNEPLHALGGLFAGVPSSMWIERCFAAPAGADIDEDSQVGWLMFLPILPFEATAMTEAAGLVARISHETGVPIRATINIITDRAIDYVISLRFERTPAGIAAAHAAYDRLHREFAARGFFPYRTAIDRQDPAVLYGDPVYIDLLKQLRRTLDPNGVLSSGRYLPDDDRPA